MSEVEILYVDDEPDILELVEVYFLDQGLRIKTFVDPLQALEHFAEHPYALVISDARMPRMKGVDLLRELQQRYGYAGKFIIVSGHYELEVVPEQVRGVSRILTKPIDFEELFAVVREALASKS